MCKTSILLFAIAATAASGQGTLIGTATRNGSFEDGGSPPWSGINAVSNDAPFATHGGWFGVVQSAIRTDSSQNIPVNPLEGRAFLVSFDARTVDSGFNSMSIFINTQNADGSAVLPGVTSILSPPLVSTAWNAYQSLFSFPESWNGNSIRLGIGFRGGVSGGPILTGYLDNIVLQQIPEPSFFSLCLTAGILACHRLIHSTATDRLRQRRPSLLGLIRFAGHHGEGMRYNRKRT